MGCVASPRLDGCRGTSVQPGSRKKKKRQMGKEASAGGLAGSKLQERALGREGGCFHQSAAAWHP